MFKPGDEVRILRIKTSAHYESSYTSSMQNLENIIGVIVGPRDQDEETYGVRIRGRSWWIHQDDLALSQSYFKPGDIVRITRIKDSPQYDWLYVDAGMEYLQGQCGQVKRVEDMYVIVEHINDEWSIAHADLELVQGMFMDILELKKVFSEDFQVTFVNSILIVLDRNGNIIFDQTVGPNDVVKLLRS
jgi:hypothetical protein